MTEEMNKELGELTKEENLEITSLEPLTNEESDVEVIDEDSRRIPVGAVAIGAVGAILLVEGVVSIAKKGKAWVGKRIENHKMRKTKDDEFEEDEDIIEEFDDEDSDEEPESEKKKPKQK